MLHLESQNLVLLFPYIWALRGHSSFHWTSIFDWYLAMYVVKNEHQKRTRIAPRLTNESLNYHILGSIINIIMAGFMRSLEAKEKQIHFTLKKFSILLQFWKIEMRLWKLCMRFNGSLKRQSPRTCISKKGILNVSSNLVSIRWTKL